MTKENLSSKSELSDCLSQDYKVSDKSVNAIKERVFSRTWNDAQDDLVRKLVNKHGARKWSFIARFIPGKRGKQVRQRWCNHLNPLISKQEWSYEQEWILFLGCAVFENKWAQLSKILKGRSDNSVKNHWNSAMKKKLKVFSQILQDLLIQTNMTHLSKESALFYLEKEHYFLELIKNKKKPNLEKQQNKRFLSAQTPLKTKEDKCLSDRKQRQQMVKVEQSFLQSASQLEFNSFNNFNCHLNNSEKSNQNFNKMFQQQHVFRNSMINQFALKSPSHKSNSQHEYSSNFVSIPVYLHPTPYYPNQAPVFQYQIPYMSYYQNMIGKQNRNTQGFIKSNRQNNQILEKIHFME